MTTRSTPPAAARTETPWTPPASPELWIVVEDADMLPSAAVPTLRFELRIDSTRGVQIRSLSLETRVDVAAPLRPYDEAEKERLVELFGAEQQWSTSLRHLFWTRTTLSVPAFSGSTRATLLIGCTYDFETAVVKYFESLSQGDIPLEFLFSGAIFYVGDNGSLQIARIPWDTQAQFRLPLDAWQSMMERHFPDSAWIRLDKETVQRLYAYKSRNTLRTLDDAVASLLGITER